MWNKYQESKTKIKKMVEIEMIKHEETVTSKIMQDKNRSKRLWQHVDQLRNKKKNRDKEIVLYDNNGNKLREEVIPSALEDTWKKILQMHPNEVHEEWNPELRRKYREEINNWNNTCEHRYRIGITNRRGVFVHEYDRVTFNQNMREHMDYAFEITNRSIEPMENTVIEIKM